MADSKAQTAKVFILTGEWMDVKGRNLLKFTGISNEYGPVEINVTNNPVFFVKRSSDTSELKVSNRRKEVKLKNFEEQDIDALYFNTETDLRTAAEELEDIAIINYESDINPTRRFLMERFINAQVKVTGNAEKKGNLLIFTNPQIEPTEVTPQFVVASIDIETGNNNTILYSIAVHLTGKSGEEKIVFLQSDKKETLPGNFYLFKSEKELLQNFITWFNKADPDIIIGWHVIGFDLMFLESKCNEFQIPFNLARGNGRVSLRSHKPRGYFASISGRVVIDGPPALRSSFFTFEDYRLETVAQEMLAEGKSVTPDQNKVEEIERLYKEDKAALAEYNLKDAELVTDIFNKSGLIDLSIRRSQLSGLLMDQLGMMTAAFDHFYLPKLHRAGYVAPNVKDIDASEHAASGSILKVWMIVGYKLLKSSTTTSL